MGLVGDVQKFDLTDEEGEHIGEVTADFGGGNVLDPEHYSAPGIDSRPLPGDYVATASVPGDTGEAAVGYIDSVNVSKAADGEFRVYARDATGAEVCEMWLKGDGSIRMENENGFVELGADGVANINDNFTVDP